MPYMAANIRRSFFLLVTGREELSSTEKGSVGRGKHWPEGGMQVCRSLILQPLYVLPLSHANDRPLSVMM